MSYKINRRHFLASTGAMLLLPALESVISPRALGLEFGDPRRFVCFYFPNGPYNRKDFPTWVAPIGKHTATTAFGPVFTPFAADYADFSILNGISNKALDDIFPYCAAGGHVSNMTYLTGYGILPTQETLKNTVNSLDQVIARAKGKDSWVLNGGTDQRSFSGVQLYDNFARYTSFKDGVGQIGTSNPGDLYRDLMKKVAFTGTPTAPPTTGVNKDKSVLDASLADLNQLINKVSRNDKQRLQEYMAGLRDLERTFASTTVAQPASAACTKPTLDASVDKTSLSDSEGYYKRFRAFNDFIRLAFACDVIRSVAIMMDFESVERPELGAASSNLIYEGVDCKGIYKHIGVSHASEIDVNARKASVTRDRSYLAMVFDLVAKLRSVNDPSGSRMLDNTMILAGHGIADGNHSDCLAIQRTVLCAGGKNFLKPGTSYDTKSYDQRDLLFTAQKHMGVELASFGGSSKVVPI